MTRRVFGAKGRDRALFFQARSGGLRGSMRAAPKTFGKDRYRSSDKPGKRRGRPRGHLRRNDALTRPIDRVAERRDLRRRAARMMFAQILQMLSSRANGASLIGQGSLFFARSSHQVCSSSAALASGAGAARLAPASSISSARKRMAATSFGEPWRTLFLSSTDASPPICSVASIRSNSRASSAEFGMMRRVEF